MVQTANGVMYGTTSGGGAGSFGTVFQITTNGTLATLHSFSDTDGSYPYSGLALGHDGLFYGTTFVRRRERHGHRLQDRYQWNPLHALLVYWRD